MNCKAKFTSLLDDDKFSVIEDRYIFRQILTKNLAKLNFPFHDFHWKISLDTYHTLKEINSPTNILKVGLVYHFMRLANVSDNFHDKIYNKFSADDKKIIEDLLKISTLEITIPGRQKEYNNEFLFRAMVDKLPVLISSNNERERLLNYIIHGSPTEKHLKYFISTAKNISSLFILLADRLSILNNLFRSHNYHYNVDEATIQQIAFETLTIHVKIADYLGIGKLKRKLEDAAFKNIDLENYEKISQFIHENKEKREKYIKLVKDDVDDVLKKQGISARIEGRPKNVFSIYKKMKTRNFNLPRINDLLGIRIIIDDDDKIDIENCYLTLKSLFSKWEPVEGVYENNKLCVDWIKQSKPNGYQSIHTTLLFDGKGIFKNDQIIEVQIRTEKMDEIASYGSAAHWLYKESSSEANGNGKTKNHNLWSNIKRYFSVNSSSPDVCDQKKDWKQYFDTCMVLSPKGEIFELDKNSTPVDFAFKIKAEFGEQVKNQIDQFEFIVNSEPVSPHSLLNNGDIVKISPRTH